jgi:hypothetical protein
MQQPIRYFDAYLAATIVVLNLLVAPNAALSADHPRIVNVTSDSEKGWLPSEDQERQARKTAVDYLADMDSGKYAEAYAFLTAMDRKDQPLPAFSDRLREFNKRAGPVVGRRVATVTWTKNPANAPIPGIYAALDLVSTFANVDRHCGYLVLYQAPSGGDFQVMREENNFLDNAMAASISKKSSTAEVDRVWANVSAHCPGYHSPKNFAAQSSPLPEATSSTIGYPTVDAALAALRAKAGVVFANQDGWTIATDETDRTFWSFPPKGHPAYPATIKRHLVTGADGTGMEMTVHCQASKKACDDLVRAFEQLNAQMAAYAHSGR